MKKGELSLLANMQDYLRDNSLRESDALRRLRVETSKDASAIMQIPPEQGQFMALLVKLVSAKRTIEVGVYTGYSTLCVAQALPSDGYIVACDINNEWCEIAKKYWEDAGVSNKIDLKIAPAVETLEGLINGGQEGSFDFIFIDADKQNYDNYYELSLRLLRKGGLLAIDNVLLFGSVMDSNPLDESVSQLFTEKDIKTVKDLNAKIKDDQRVEISMLQIADGITLAMKN